MKRYSHSSLLFVPLVLVLAACGGAGDFLAGAQATLTATPSPVTVGEPVTITWGGNKLTHGKSNDFGADINLLSGTIQDRTAVSLDYHFSAYGKNGDNPEIVLNATASVQVTKSTKSVVVIGDPAIAGTNQVADYMRGITTGSVRVIDGSDVTSVTEDLIILHSSIASSLTASTWSDVVLPWLTAGKSVMVIGEDTLKGLGGGNVSTVGGYFGGASGFSGGILPTEKVRSTDGLVPLSIKYRGQRITLDAGGGRGVTGIGGSSDILISSSAGSEAFVYKLATLPGKTAFLMHDGVGSSGTDAYYAWAMQSMARWCLDL
ncbi:MAG: hypothetical protein JST12_13105 [Armatimonadetes bacterium]|nr:hypothetical protein [Armatimonadota bacterium]